MPIANATPAALVWLLLLLIVTVVYAAFQVRRNAYSLWETCLYIPVMLVGRILWRVTFMNEPPPEIDGGALLVANHRSSVDPFFVQLAARRRVHWMVAREFCEHPVFGAILRPLLVIPTNRSGMDTASMKIAMRLTNAGRMVGMFPEGKINLSRQTLLPLRAGAALIAMRSRVPIIPLWIDGSPYCKTVWSPLLMPSNVRITFGQAIAPGAYEDAPQEDAEEPQLSSADAMILDWGRQILELSGDQRATPELASTRRKKPRKRNSLVVASE